MKRLAIIILMLMPSICWGREHRRHVFGGGGSVFQTSRNVTLTGTQLFMNSGMVAVQSSDPAVVNLTGSTLTLSSGNATAQSVASNVALTGTFLHFSSATVTVAGGGGTTYYVSTTGNDSTGNGSYSTPWAKPSHACGAVSAGSSAANANTISILSGSYTDNSACTLALFVNIAGAGITSTTITTSANPYISGANAVPTVGGAPTISGIAFIGSGSNTGIYMRGRNNLKVHDSAFTNFGSVVDIAGKTPIWNSDCTDNAPTQSATYCDDIHDTSIEPDSTDWATGFEFYSNTITNGKIYPETIKNALIHDNTINNSTSLKSAVGNTAKWWSGVEFYNNTITMQTNAWSTIALEIWMVEDDSKFYNNTTNGWFSILLNPNGPKTPYSYEITNNTFASNVVPGIGSSAISCALETGSYTENMLIAGNYFTNTGSNNTYSLGIAMWGNGINENFTIRNNVFYNINGDGITIHTDGTSGAPFAGSNINIYNNTFDTMHSGGTSQAVYIHTVSGAGTITTINMANNVIKNASHGMLADGGQLTSSTYRYNIMASASPTSGTGITASNNINGTPGITGSGSRPSPYYLIPNTSSNLYNAGVNVGLPFNSTAPDLGAYEY